MANIPGVTNGLPGVYTDVITSTRGASIPGGTRVAAVIGEGSTNETIISQALGDGNDGLDSTFTSPTGSDGRHFRLVNYPIISNRLKLYKNGELLTGLEYELGVGETSFGSSTFSNRYQYRYDITNGLIELQQAYLSDDGYKYKVGVNNTGTGNLTNITLVDPNAPSEVWTVKCISVLRDGVGAPITQTAQFVAIGSVSGTILDTNGNQILWKSNGVTGAASNGILSFQINEGGTVFIEGDYFTIQVISGALLSNDSLTAVTIPTLFLNDAQTMSGLNDVVQKHGLPSTDNTLSLGAQLAFSNAAPVLVCVQAAPSLPRRGSYILENGLNESSVDPKDFKFPLPLGVQPNESIGINFFVTNPVTKIETQLILNKWAFSTVDGSPDETTFVNNSTYNYGYTALKDYESLYAGNDGYLLKLTGTTAEFSVSGISFDSSMVGKKVRITDAVDVDNISTAGFTVTSVVNGKLRFTVPAGATTESGLEYNVIDDTVTSWYVLINKTVAVGKNGYQLRVTLVDEKDADFFDPGWVNALETLESVDVDIIVPLPKQTISVIAQNTLQHCIAMSNIVNRKERVMFTGALQGLTPDNVLGNKLAAVEDIGVMEGIQGDSLTEILLGTTEDLANYSVQNAYSHTYRCVYFYPDQIVANVGGVNTALDGMYMAAAAAGYLSADVKLENPLTNKVLSGFTILRDKRFSPTVLRSLAAKGITVLQPVTGGGKVVWGLTTTNSGFVEEQEISIVFIRDRVAKTLRDGFAGFIGKAESDVSKADIVTRAVIILNSLVSQRLLTKYASLTVKRDDADPTQWNIGVQVQPNYPINFIYIKVNVGRI